MPCLNFQLFSLLWQYQSIFTCQGFDSHLTISQWVDEIKRIAPLASKDTIAWSTFSAGFFFQLFELPFLFCEDYKECSQSNKSFAKKCGNTLILNFVSFETTWCCYNANLQVCSPISRIYYYMIILYCYQPYVRHIMIHVLVPWLIILHNTPFSKFKRNIPILLNIANGLIFIAKNIRG